MSTPWWVPVLSVVVTGLLGLVAQQWAARGKKLVDLNGMANNNAETAMKMASEALDRVAKVETENAWVRTVVELKDRYIVTLLAHIHAGNPPPPPIEPIYPSRPQ